MDRTQLFHWILGAATGSLLVGGLLPLAVGESSDRSSVPARTGPGNGATAVERTEADADHGPQATDGRASSGTRNGSVDDGAGAGAPGDSAAAGRAPGADAGVTADAVKLGFLLLDVGSLSRFGVAVAGVDPAQQIASYEAYLAEINDAGGINGRKVVAAYQRFDPTNQDSMRAACVALTEDHRVFAIGAPGGFGGPALLCITEEHGTPLVSHGGVGTPSEYVRRSGGRLFSLFQASDRAMANWAQSLHDLGALDGKRIGILTGEEFDPSEGVVKGALVPALERVGARIEHVSRLARDPATGASQVPVAVQQMRTKSVDLVFLVTTTVYATAFVQAADNQRYHPQYTASDWAGMSNDTSNQNMPTSYDGTLVMTQTRLGARRVSEPPGQPELACEAVYEQRSGRSLSRDEGEVEWGMTQTICQLVRIMRAGMQGAGSELTRATFRRGVEQMGEFEMTQWFRGSFGPGKSDASDWSRPLRWRASCRCVVPDGSFVRARH